ncbi:DUF5949 family protein [Actinomadura violacea]|uniref:Uncharacterized protein n=1 Tax=Actinomadura violacea TaxID=2819934 RepID=A0ABS3RLI0_9ACTN|nr:DUF5949 family protein [Actinomadura violacea]MBO2457476.1 hypothetical protein [Actinomadura violacea]
MSPRANDPVIDPREFGGIALTGWVGPSPEDSGDYPFLLLYTTGGTDRGVSAAILGMAALLKAHGLHVGEMLHAPDQLTTTTARVVVNPGHFVELRWGDDEHLASSTHVTAEWEHAARSRREVLLTACVRPFRRGPMTVDARERFMDERETQRSSAFAFLSIA